MSAPRLVLFDDRVARAWRPFTLTRPAGELVFGIATLRSRAEHAFGLRCDGHISLPHLAPFDEPWAPPVLDPGAVQTDRGSVFLLSRYVAHPEPLPDRPALLTAGGRVVGCRTAPGAPPPGADFFHDPEDHAPDLPTHPLTGSVLDHVWDLMSGNAERVARDIGHADRRAVPAGIEAMGDSPISLGTGVRLAPGTVLDTRDGPIRIDDDVEVRPFTSLRGPAYIGPGSIIFGGRFEGVSIGPVCKVHGEMEETVFLGYANKAHDGFLGHAYVGLWVNLGAMTTNSDLKNNYGTVRLWTPDGHVDTGLRKIGCLLGDHVKTAIGTLLNTGTVLEAGSNVFGGMPPSYLPPFSWGDPDTPYDLDRFLDTAATVMGRRDIELSAPQRELLGAAWRTGRAG